MDDKLNSEEQSNLAECEAAIERILGGFYETGGALQKIRDERLYRATHATFEKYCRERWGFSRQRANQLIGASGVIESLTTMVVKPATERQAREMIGLDPDDQRKVWQTALETAPGGLITAAHIRDTREALINSPKQETLFTLDDYHDAIEHHVSIANHHRSVADFHVRRATQLRDEAFKKFGVQIDLPFEFGDR